MTPRALFPAPCLPRSSTMSLSMPRGPSVVRTASAITWHALMLLTSCGMPCEVSVPSFSRITGVGCRRTTAQLLPPIPATRSKLPTAQRDTTVQEQGQTYRLAAIPLLHTAAFHLPTLPQHREFTQLLPPQALGPHSNCPKNKGGSLGQHCPVRF